MVNQTTLLMNETSAIIDYFKNLFVKKYGEIEGPAHVGGAGKKDTLCYATNDNQTAVSHLLNQPADLAIVIGGKKSSNSSHLVELCEEKLHTYFIESEEDILSDKIIKAYNWRTHEEYTKEGYLPEKQEIKIQIDSYCVI